ncbi:MULTISPECIES: helix-turn-helix domain-containing protein [Photorhabdus]|uniref:Transcriptional regulator n=2 Tax=Photorhabdus TaxID=29487 RepID=A0A7C9KWX6_9GAMM|nr:MULTISPECIES: helix-turn-helix domain-containing protein [Photorhabdus]MQL50032.1 hypothetical protein [Photorhabdus khanii]MQL50129.1 hypothetical protein [Photorhabdus khanii]NHB98763.1 hypothetical protein [Photorhabdus stackebrandtii]
MTPIELRRLQAKTGLSKQELALRLDMSPRTWENLISVNPEKKLPKIKYELLLLLAGEHPEYKLVSRN